MDWIEITLGGVIAICVLLLIFVLDTFFTTKEVKLCTAIGRSFQPAYTYSSLVLVGEVLIPQTHYVPDSWYIDYNFDGQTASVQVDKDTYDKYKKNWQHKIRKHRGFLTGRIVGYDYSN